MARKSSPRRWSKRTTRALHRRMDVTMTRLLELKDAFDPDHPELGEVLEVVAKTIHVAQSLLDKFYEDAWGMIPGDWNSDV